MDICFTFDKFYIQNVAAAINSIINNNNIDNITFHLIYSNIKNSKLNILLNWLQTNNCKFVLYNINSKKFQFCPLIKNDRLTKAAYYRISIADILSNNIKKVLYLDPDTIINNNLQELFNINLENYSLGAVSALQNYFNSGVLLLNLEYWRKHNITEKLFDYIYKNSNNLQCHDQDAMNTVLEGTWLKLPLKYNMGTQILRILRRSIKLNEPIIYTQEEINEAREFPAIIHYAGSFHYKPWYKNCIHQYQNLYLENLKCTPYKNFKLKRNYILDIMKNYENPYPDLSKEIFQNIKQAFSDSKYNLWKLFIRKMYQNKNTRNRLFNILTKILYCKMLVAELKVKYTKKVKPFQITIDISGKCNAKCPFCLRQIKGIKNNEFMPKEVFYKIIEQVKEINSIKVISLSAYGEPLLHPNFDEFVSYLHRMNYNILVTTNMSLADKHYDSLLKVSHIMFSLEGWDKSSYEKYRKNLNFEKVYGNIKEFDSIIKIKRQNKEKTPSRAINFLVTKNSQIKEFITLWKPYSDLIHIGLMKNPISWDSQNQCFKQICSSELKQEIIPSLQLKGQNNCTQPFNVITIQSNGKLRFCCNDYDCSYNLGDYKNIREYFKNPYFKLIRKEILNKKLNICKNCFGNSEASLEYLSQYLPEITEINAQNERL